MKPSSIAALILAAGQSKRMGQPKMLLPWGESTVLQTVVAAFRAAGVEDYVRSDTRIGARVADAVDAERLEIAQGRPVIEIDCVNADLAGRPIQWARARFAGDRVRVTVG